MPYTFNWTVLCLNVCFLLFPNIYILYLWILSNYLMGDECECNRNDNNGDKRNIETCKIFLIIHHFYATHIEIHIQNATARIYLGWRRAGGRRTQQRDRKGESEQANEYI